jgi:hypothetical protein
MVRITVEYFSFLPLFVSKTGIHAYGCTVTLGAGVR